MIATPRADEALDSCASARRPGSVRSWTTRSAWPADVANGAFRPMKVQNNDIKFRSLPAGLAGGWRVEIQIGTDQLQNIYRFDSQFDADEWIQREAEEWMKLLGPKL